MTKADTASLDQALRLMCNASLAMMAERQTQIPFGDDKGQWSAFGCGGGGFTCDPLGMAADVGLQNERWRV